VTQIRGLSREIFLDHFPTCWRIMRTCRRFTLALSGGDLDGVVAIFSSPSVSAILCIRYKTVQGHRPVFVPDGHPYRL
jgi:hypothetical protein